jgi:predicted RNA-binding protein with TRAM domain
VCGGDGVVLSEASAAVDVERHLRALAASAPRTKAFKVELNAKVASMLVGPGASKLMAIEEEQKRRFLIQFREDVAVNHFEVLGKGTLESLVGGDARAEREGKQVDLKLVEVGRHDVHAGVGKLDDGLTVVVGNAASMVGKRAKVRIERVLDGVAYASLVGGKKAPEEPITAESAAEKPTRKPPAKKQAEQATTTDEVEEAEETEEPEEAEPDAPEEDEMGVAEPEAEAEEDGDVPTDQPAKKKTRRGSRGGRRRKKKPAGATPVEANGDARPEPPVAERNGEPEAEAPRIHLPDPSLGRDEPAQPEPAPQPEAEAPSANGEGEQPTPKKKTRRGSRGGRRRRKPASAQAGDTPAEPSEPSPAV